MEDKVIVSRDQYDYLVAKANSNLFSRVQYEDKMYICSNESDIFEDMKSQIEYLKKQKEDIIDKHYKEYLKEQKDCHEKFSTMKKYYEKQLDNRQETIDKLILNIETILHRPLLDRIKNKY